MQIVLVPVDGSPSSKKAVEHVIDMIRRGLACDVHLLHVQQPFALNDVPEIAKPGLVERLGLDEADKAFGEVRRMLAEAGIRHSERTEMGDPAQEIALYCDVHGCDQVVMGTRGLGPVKSMVMGSVATKVLHLVSVPVTLVK